MFLMMIWILAVSSAVFELYVAFKLPAYLRLVEKFPVVALVVSITLSWFLGKIFGAAGLIALMGGLCSTLMTLACYIVLAKWHSGEIPAKLEKYKADFESVKQLGKDVWHIIYIVLRIITFPLWGYRSIKEWCSNRIPTIRRNPT